MSQDEHPQFDKFLRHALTDPKVRQIWIAGLPERMAHTVQWHLDASYRESRNDDAPASEYVAALAAAINHHIPKEVIQMPVSKQMPDGTWRELTDDDSLPMQGWKRVPNFLAWWDERGL